MKLNKLRIFGFKSFANEVELEFPSGLIAIVGPNGCGKSNICDAIRWVLGEQSARLLRGKEMGDVIFNGTSIQKPMGMAEVTLELTNLGSLPIEFQQVQITRRLYRSGESEYLLNKRPSRLKDITDLFLQWGINKRVYSVIEQGNIDFILSSKPSERRMLIETAAGIMKYKERRRETEVKIDQTKANLIRVQDILREVEIQRESLQKQAKRAKSYLTLCQQSEEKERSYLQLRYKILIYHLLKAKSQYDDLYDKERGLVTNLSCIEAEREKLRLETTLLQSDFEKLQKGVWAIEGEKARMEKRLDTLNHEKRFRIDTLERLSKELELNNEKRGKSKSNLKDFEEKLSSLKRELTAREKTQKDLEEEKNLSQKIDKQISDTIQGKRGELIEKNKRISLIQSNLSHLRTKSDALRQRLSENAIEVGEVEQAFERINEAITNTEKEREGILSQIRTSSEAVHRLTQEHEKIEKLLADIQSNIDKQKGCCAGLRHRQNHLESLEKGMEGYQAAVRHLLKDKLNNSGITLAQIISTQSQYECALETVLGDTLQSILVKSKEDALEMIEELKASDKGKANFLPESAESAPEPRSITPEVMGHPGFIGKLIDLVDCPPTIQKNLNYLLARYLLVKDIDTALYIEDNDREGAWDIVTIEGDIIRSCGMVTGGSSKSEKTDSSILSRKRELAELNELVLQEDEKLTQFLKEKGSLTDNDKRIKGEIERAKAETTKVEDRNRGLERDLMYLDGESEKLNKRKSKLFLLQTQWENSLEKIQKELLVENERAQALARECSDTERQIEELQGKWEGMQGVKKSIDQKYMEESIALATLKERILAQDREREKVEYSLKEREKGIQRTLNDIEGLKRKIHEEEGESSAIEGKLPGINTRIIEDQGHLEQMREALNNAKQTLMEKEDQLRPLQHELDVLRKDLKTREIEVTQWKTRIEDLRQAFSIDWPEEIPAQDEIPICEEEIEKLKGDLDRLNTRIQSFGPVNMGAIDEFVRVDERYQFLNKQIQDLQDALNSLRDIIRQINTTSRELFQDAFTEVNRDFNQLFVRLFEGGFAELRLEEGVDCLDAGIDITAQPPGKRLQSIELLSGGERALTALALIFAVYQQKPSPFCILDEVDAPLDEANVERYLRLIKEMKGKTQFIAITHCKKTMMEVDALYGVTMESPGISKIVSVKLEEPLDLYASPIARAKGYQGLVQ